MSDHLLRRERENEWSVYESDRERNPRQHNYDDKNPERQFSAFLAILMYKLMPFRIELIPEPPDQISFTSFLMWLRVLFSCHFLDGDNFLVQINLEIQETN